MIASSGMKSKTLLKRRSVVVAVQPLPKQATQVFPHSAVRRGDYGWRSFTRPWITACAHPHSGLDSTDSGCLPRLCGNLGKPSPVARDVTVLSALDCIVNAGEVGQRNYSARVTKSLFDSGPTGASHPEARSNSVCHKVQVPDLCCDKSRGRRFVCRKIDSWRIKLLLSVTMSGLSVISVHVIPSFSTAKAAPIGSRTEIGARATVFNRLDKGTSGQMPKFTWPASTIEITFAASPACVFAAKFGNAAGTCATSLQHASGSSNLPLQRPSGHGFLLVAPPPERRVFGVRGRRNHASASPLP